MLKPCSPNCCTQPGDDVLDLGRIDPGAREELDVRGAQEVRRVRVLEVALLRMPAPDRGADGFDDDDFPALLTTHVGARPSVAESGSGQRTGCLTGVRGARGGARSGRRAYADRVRWW
jgi:hypothetical protein